MAKDNLAAFYFHQGTNFRAYEYLGVNKTVDKVGRYIYSFRTWAPNAKAVSLISDFTDWNYGTLLKKVTDNGVWELIIESDVDFEKMPYKYRIYNNNGYVDKGDPYARFSRGKDDGASLVFTSNTFKWEDADWFKHRNKAVLGGKNAYFKAPMNIYEVHFASFLRHEEDNRYYTYREMADVLIPYVKNMGYTHIEFLPLAEYPYDGSWGYQVCGFYAPTSRFGDPDDLRYFINKCHTSGIGVILDWVPAHFPKDEWGLYEFDGTPLYEYQGKDRQESRSWGTRFFDLGREEVQSFLISNALYFLREFHFDGLRVDAVASMLYLDYDREPGEWVPNKDGGNINLEAVAFFKKLNTTVFSEFPDALMIAEESTSYVGITHPVASGGLGFNFKWNMGLANDIYSYVQLDPIYRKYDHKALNFPLMYAFKENYILPISHDEVVHGKLSFVDKMHGGYEDKFRQARVTLMLWMTYPGKKMLFMGTEYAQFREWDFDNSLEWFMLDYEKHKEFRDYTRSLNMFYLSHSELWDLDFDQSGFEWIYADANEQNMVAFKRKNTKGESVTVILSYSGADQLVTIPLTKGKTKLEVLFDTGCYSSAERITVRKSEGCNIAEVRVPKFSGVILRETTSRRKII